ncbi:MAG: ABC transporter permease [Candidatus Binatia bacterium]
MRVGDVIEDAVRGVRLYRVRSLLTAVGFAAGTAAAIALFAITGGARAEILRRLGELGIDLVAIRPVGEARRTDPPALTYGDVEDLRRSLRFVREAAPVRAIASSVLLPTERVSVRAVGTTPEFFHLRRLRFARGRSFTAREVARGDRVCVLGAAAARRLVRGGEAYGALVKIGGNWYRVVGVLTTEVSGAPDSSGEQANPEREVYLPITHTFAPDAFRRQGLAEAWLALAPSVEADSAAPVIERALERRHDGRQHFEVNTAARLVAEHRATRGLLNRLLLLVCCAAFLLGAVGMTTVSWQNVRDRSREIAIRRAVGARRGEVLAQFLFEGIVVAAAGAAAGVVVGVAGSGIAAWANGWPWMLSPLAALASIAAALGVAAAATLYPAAYAAALDPVAGLRFER